MAAASPTDAARAIRVARRFPAPRPLEWAVGDADVLKLLEEIGYPAERCATAGPVSQLDGQAVLVTGRLPAIA
jgi:hypothetical protein